MDYQDLANSLRKEIFAMHCRANASHIASALSCVDILITLFFRIMKTGPKCRDRFILSKGHAVSALYAVLAEKGYFPKKELKTYCLNGSKLFGHATRASVPGLEVSTGSLGHGLSIATGMALAAKYDGLKQRIFVVLGDGECNEGAIWEAAMFASRYHLDNLIVIVDYNKLQAFGRTNEILHLEPFKNKWEAFGWACRETNGHDFEKMGEVLEPIPFQKSKPSVVIAHTIKGKSVSFMENKIKWHYCVPDSEQLQIALTELNGR